MITLKDASNCIFIAGIAVMLGAQALFACSVPVFSGGSHHESEDNWVFALKHIRQTLQLDDLQDGDGLPEKITVMSDRDKGIIAALPHAVCSIGRKSDE